MSSLRPGQDAVYLSRLTVQNIRCFAEKAELLLCDENGQPRQWNILLGENGVGKTTLLQCIALMAPHPVAVADDHKLSLSPHLMGVALAKGFVRTGRRAEGLISSWPEPLLESTPLTWEARVELLLRGSYDHTAFETRSIPSDAYQVSSNSFYEDTDELHSFQVYAYGAARHLGPSTLHADEPRDATATLFMPSAGLLDANEWLLRLDYFSKLEPDGPYGTQFERVRELLIELLPDVLDINIRAPGRREKPSSAKALDHLVLFKTEYGEVPLSELSLGYQAMLAWLVDFAARMFERYPDSHAPLAEPAVVLIDEIDLHLHPRWQQSVVDYLTEAFPRTQFVVTAHSPLVAQAAAEDANIVLLRRQGDHVVIDNQPEIVRSWRVDQVLTSDLFGLPSGRAPRVSQLMDERTALLSRGVQTDQERARIAAIDEELGVLPAAERREDRELLDQMRVLAALLQKQGQGGE